MIDELHVQNLALIKDTNVSFSSGMTVITGETGAGKSAFLSALKLLVGERADAQLVRQGECELRVEARYFSEDNDQIVALRRVSDDGRSRVNIDGSMAPVKELASRIGVHVDLCGQHAHQDLMNTRKHLPLLDLWAAEEITPAKNIYKKEFSYYKQAEKELLALQKAAQSDQSALQEARFIAAQIEEINPQVHEYEELLEQAPLLEHGELLKQGTAQAYYALSGEQGAIDKLGQAILSLEEAARFDAQLQPYLEGLQESGYVLEDSARSLRTYSENIDFDAFELERLQQRLQDMQSLMRRFGPRMEDVFSKWEEAKALINSVDNSDILLEEAQQKLSKAEIALRKSAEHLHDLRAYAAPRFSQEVQQQMARLEMGSAQLVLDLKPLDFNLWTKEGSDSLEFLFSAGSSMKPRPLVRIASGGEVSRVMLAIKVVLGQADEVSTLVFDEVDAGVGGATALALADVLKDLSRTHQVIVVTHLPQVAVQGDVHYLVKKEEFEKGLPETQLQYLNEKERIYELARMLSGSIDATSLEHAQALMDNVLKK